MIAHCDGIQFMVVTTKPQVSDLFHEQDWGREWRQGLDKTPIQIFVQKILQHGQSRVRPRTQTPHWQWHIRNEINRAVIWPVWRQLVHFLLEDICEVHNSGWTQQLACADLMGVVHALQARERDEVLGPVDLWIMHTEPSQDHGEMQAGGNIELNSLLMRTNGQAQGLLGGLNRSKEKHPTINGLYKHLRTPAGVR